MRVATTTQLHTYLLPALKMINDKLKLKLKFEKNNNSSINDQQLNRYIDEFTMNIDLLEKHEKLLCEFVSVNRCNIVVANFLLFSCPNIYVLSVVRYVQHIHVLLFSYTFLSFSPPFSLVQVL